MELEVSPNKVELGFRFLSSLLASLAGVAPLFRTGTVGSAPGSAGSGATIFGASFVAPPRLFRRFDFHSTPAYTDFIGSTRCLAAIFVIVEPTPTPLPLRQPTSTSLAISGDARWLQSLLSERRHLQIRAPAPPLHSLPMAGAALLGTPSPLHHHHSQAPPARLASGRDQLRHRPGRRSGRRRGRPPRAAAAERAHKCRSHACVSHMRGLGHTRGLLALAAFWGCLPNGAHYSCVAYMHLSLGMRHRWQLQEASSAGMDAAAKGIIYKVLQVVATLEEHVHSCGDAVVDVRVDHALSLSSRFDINKHVTTGEAFYRSTASSTHSSSPISSQTDAENAVCAIGLYARLFGSQWRRDPAFSTTTSPVHYSSEVLLTSISMDEACARTSPTIKSNYLEKLQTCTLGLRSQIFVTWFS